MAQIYGIGQNSGGTPLHLRMTRLTAAVVAAIVLAASGCTAPSSAQPSRLGTIDFPTSGSVGAKPHFIRGVLFLHSFEYDSAAKEFQRAQAADPGFAMAYWGEAMTKTHPVWDEQDVAAARTALGRLAPTASVRRAKAAMPREKDYLNAVEILYGEGSKPRRDTLYSAAMKKIADAYPDDLEAKAFYSLSLLGLNQGVRDPATYQRAGAIAESVFGKNADHPGGAHYVIHSYDDPDNAPRGLNAARAYSKIAPGAAHAQHMTTHIFLAMGMWDDVVSQNEIASGHDHDAWTPNHYTQWLSYAYLQQGRYNDALHMLEKMKAGNARGRQLWGFTTMRARYLIDSEQWDSPAATWPSDLSALGNDGAAYWAFVNGLKAIRKNDRAGASTALTALTQADAAAGASIDPTNAILEKELTALVRLSEGKKDEAISLMREATRREDAMPFEFGPPFVLKPSHELFGEMLLEIGMPKEAHVEFSRALHLAPKRARSLLGLARAAMAMGDSPAAAKAYAELRSVWHNADPAVKNLSELKTFGGT
jgi:tetratricopeptide (TPR) repeat protein